MSTIFQYFLIGRQNVKCVCSEVNFALLKESLAGTITRSSFIYRCREQAALLFTWRYDHRLFDVLATNCHSRTGNFRNYGSNSRSLIYTAGSTYRFSFPVKWRNISIIGFNTRCSSLYAWLIPGAGCWLRLVYMGQNNFADFFFLNQDQICQRYHFEFTNNGCLKVIVFDSVPMITALTN